MEEQTHSPAGGGCRVVDLRSDTVAHPSQAMKEAMMTAPLGDDVFGEDPTVNALQEKVAAMLGKEAGLFVPSGTMANLICVLHHCQHRGSEVLLGHLSHIHLCEQGGIAQVGGVHPRTLKNLPDGTFSLEELRQKVRGENDMWPVTALVCVENTHNMVGGKVLSLAWLDELGATCRELGLPLHMDGARLFNAATVLQLPASRLVQDCSTVNICLSKGLGAPVGSVIAGSADFIRSARRLRRVLGGAMRQAGILAAAGIYALDRFETTLDRDHRNLQDVARAVVECESEVVKCDPEGAHTNILLLECDPKVMTPGHLCQRMGQVSEEEAKATGQRVVVRILPFTEYAARLVVHCDITKEDIKSVIKKLKYVIKEFNSQTVIASVP
nr:probable low-specificity L-threonine aldolase 2 [Procambarus clarkii]